MIGFIVRCYELIRDLYYYYTIDADAEAEVWMFSGLDKMSYLQIRALKGNLKHKLKKDGLLWESDTNLSSEETDEDFILKSLQ